MIKFVIIFIYSTIYWFSQTSLISDHFLYLIQFAIAEVEMQIFTDGLIKNQFYNILDFFFLSV